MLILASASPRRRELMKLITDDFTAVSLDVDETVPEKCNCHVSEYLAVLKAGKGAKLYPDNIIIGCDTIVEIGGKVLGKPKNADECREFLKMLSGKIHYVTTSCCIMSCRNKVTFSNTTAVTFRNLTDDDIEWYISTGEPFDKAGGYGIQGKGSLLIEKIDGDYFNVVGLPVSELNQQLKNFIKEL
ncbi:MAG: Maf family protein [Ruminococcus sp.]|nr:Maf family protein [Ruminococcus sp.]